MQAKHETVRINHLIAKNSTDSITNYEVTQ